MILDPDELSVREHYRVTGTLIPPCFWCGKKVERGVLSYQWGGTLLVHFECARYLIDRLEVDLARIDEVPPMLDALLDPRVRLPDEETA